MAETDTLAPVATPAPESAPTPPASISEHADTFGPGGEPPPPDDDAPLLVTKDADAGKRSAANFIKSCKALQEMTQ